MKFRNLGRLLRDEAEDVTPEAVRMRRAPVAIKGIGEDADEKAPVRIYPSDDPRSALAPTEEGYPEEWGMDLRDPPAAAPPEAAAKPPRAAHKPAPLPDEVPEGLEGALAGLGGVADRAQAAMEQDSPKGLRGFMAKSATSAAMGAGAKPPAAIPPEVAAFAAQKAGAEPPEADPAVAKKAAFLRDLSSMTGNIHSGLDMATGMSTAGYGSGLADEADRMEKSEEDKVAAAKDFARRKFEGERQGRQDELSTRKTEAEIAALERKGAPAGEKPRDPLADRKTEAEIARIEAETAKLGRRGGGPDALAREERELKLQKLRNEVNGTKAAKGDPLGVPGFTRAPGAPDIKEEEAAAMRGVIEAQGALEPAIREMEAAKDDTGAERGWMGKGSDYAAQSAPYSKMVLGIKELAKSGALDEQSERVAQGMIPTPDDYEKTAKTKMASLRKYVQSRVDAKAAALGYVKGGGAPRPATSSVAPTTPADSGKTPVSRTPSKDGKWVRVRFSDGTEEVKRAGS